MQGGAAPDRLAERMLEVGELYCISEGERAAALPEPHCLMCTARFSLCWQGRLNKIKCREHGGRMWAGSTPVRPWHTGLPIHTAEPLLILRTLGSTS